MTIVYEWPMMVDAQKITAAPSVFALTASEQECKAIAKRLDLISLETLSANLTVTRLSDGIRLHVSGTLHAKAVQACVFTLDPVPTDLTADIAAHYLDDMHVASFAKSAKKKALKDGDDDLIEREMPDDFDEPEELIGGKLPLGELVVQHLSVTLPDYPQIDGAEDRLQERLKTLGAKENAFAVLKQLKE